MSGLAIARSLRARPLPFWKKRCRRSGDTLDMRSIGYMPEAAAAITSLSMSVARILKSQRGDGRQRFGGNHRETVRLFAGRTTRRPDAQATRRRVALHRLGQHVGGQRLEVMVLAEERSDVGGDAR